MSSVVIVLLLFQDQALVAQKRNVVNHEYLHSEITEIACYHGSMNIVENDVFREFVFSTDMVLFSSLKFHANKTHVSYKTLSSCVPQYSL